ncbi:MAG: hypothetical protein IKW76_04465 [Clostridia bacterium]|nr:hypothetical protein [Clostridia bacterium]
MIAVYDPIAAARSGKLDADIAAQTSAVAVEIESEGVVLLKNEENALPLGDKRVNVFGAGSAMPFYGGDTMLTGVWSLQKPSHMRVMRQAYARDPIGFGTALRESVRRLCSAKMRTKAFLHPERVYDDSFLGSLVSPAEWDFSFPYTSSALRYVLNNTLNTVIYLFRYIH